MTDAFRHLKLGRDDRGVVTVHLDVAGSPVNVFNQDVFEELHEVVERLERDPPKVVVFRSAKPAGFFAGADVHRIRRLETPEEVDAILEAGQELFERVEQLPCPTVAVIHGMCLGGGLEFALACRHRVARDDAQTKLGLPEVQLGLIPGWGGTQRLPRVVGVRRALEMILTGTTLSAAKATKAGLIDVAAAPEDFESAVYRFVEDRLAGRSVRHPTRGLVGTLLEGTWPGRSAVFACARREARSRGRNYPAVVAALRAVEAGFGGSPESGYATERAEFARVVFSPAARNLIDVFLKRELARKRSTWVPADVAASPVKRVAVLGAGTMGAGIAQLLAVNGTAVALKDVDAELVAAGAAKVEALTREAVAKGVLTAEEGDAAARRVTPATQPEALEGADVAVEAVVERLDVKREVLRELAERLGDAAVLATNTSALSVTKIAETTPHPERVAGLHFFNPVHRMPLVEVVRGEATSDTTVATLVDLVRKLGKVPVVVADSPGFLVNRILFPYLDEAVRLVLEGVPGDEVDRAATRFGMPIGPLELLDQIGIDIAAHVARTFAAGNPDPGPVPERFAEMVAAGALGKKAGRGFYAYRDKTRKTLTPWAKLGGRRPPSGGDPGDLTETQKRLVYPMVNEAAKCLEARVAHEAWVIDLAMVLGTGFAPFRGGPLHTADALGVARVVRELDEFRRVFGARFEPCRLLRTMATDGRTFHAEAERTVQHA